MTNLDLAAIRRSAARGDQTPPTTVVALCDYVETEQVERESEAATLRELQYEYGQLYIAARAYFAAVDRCDGTRAAEQALREKVEQVTR